MAQLPLRLRLLRPRAPRRLLQPPLLHPRRTQAHLPLRCGLLLLLLVLLLLLLPLPPLLRPRRMYRRCLWQARPHTAMQPAARRPQSGLAGVRVWASRGVGQAGRKS